MSPALRWTIVALLWLSAGAFAEPVRVWPLGAPGVLDNRINIVIYPDGYTAADLPKYRGTCVGLASSLMQANGMFYQFANLFAVYMVEDPARWTALPGISHDVSGTRVPTPYNVTYPQADVPAAGETPARSFSGRGLYIPDDLYPAADALMKRDAGSVPVHVRLVLVNDKALGGSATNLGAPGQALVLMQDGVTAAAADGTNNSVFGMATVLAHELGHCLGTSLDEYDYAEADFKPGDCNVYTILSEREQPPAEVLDASPNLSATADPGSIKWKGWLGRFLPPYTDPVGVVEGGYGRRTGVYRPREKCLMNQMVNCDGYAEEFCEVCGEAFTNRILDLVNLVDSVSPARGQAIELAPGGQVELVVQTLGHPDGGRVGGTWDVASRGSEEDAGEPGSVGKRFRRTITAADLGPGRWEVKFQALENTRRVVGPRPGTPQQPNFVSWTIEVTNPGGLPSTDDVTKDAD